MVEAADLHALILGIVRRCRTHLYGDFGAVLHVFDRVDRAVLRCHDCELRRVEGGGEEDLAGSFFRGCHAGSRHVDFMRLQRRDESVKCNVLEFNIASQFFRYRAHYVDLIAGIVFSIFGFKFKRHIRRIRSDFQRGFARCRVCLLLAAAAGCKSECEHGRCGQCQSLFPSFHSYRLF